ncbi:MAG: class I SAM-dependent methyltransferase [Eubacterium sp.]|nr:class I SAM-dependent methyltransferase [Eubacterium sp.]
MAQFVRENASLADVGCDHGYLPAYLVLNGRIQSAVAGDINEGPLHSCIQLVADYGLEDKIKCVLSNGLQNINEEDCSDISICGMGGELIAQILDACTWSRNKDKHFILNPMTHPEILRKYLCENGFEIHKDIVVKEGRHYYSIFDAYYTGNVKSYPKSYYYLGNIHNFEYKEYFNHLLNYLENKSKGGEDFSDVISAIKEKI